MVYVNLWGSFPNLSRIREHYYSTRICDRQQILAKHQIFERIKWQLLMAVAVMTVYWAVMTRTLSTLVQEMIPSTDLPETTRFMEATIETGWMVEMVMILSTVMMVGILCTAAMAMTIY